MRSFFLASLAVAGFFSQAASKYTFSPYTSGIQLEELVDPLGLKYNLSTSQYYHSGHVDSYWISSFLTGTNDRQYLLLAQSFILPYFKAYRGAVFDIDTSTYKQFTVGPVFSGTASTKSFHTEFSDFFFGQTTDDPLGPIRCYSNRSDLAFDITFELTSPIIFDGGLGPFDWDGGNYEWSMPAGTTTGQFTFENETVTIDSSNSLTWYDRQWGEDLALSGNSINWTWFELHLDNAGPYGETCRLSQWYAQYPINSSTTIPERKYAWGTMMCVDGVNNLQAGKPLTPLGRTWTSTLSNITYNLNWQFSLVDGTTLVVESVGEDQELASPSGGLATYEGFVTVNGTSRTGQPITGWGLVEIQPPGQI